MALVAVRCRGSVVVDSLFIGATIVFWDLVFGPFVLLCSIYCHFKFCNHLAEKDRVGCIFYCLPAILGR